MKAGKDARLFAPFPIEMDEHPKIAPLSDAAFRALFEGTFYARRMLSDGFLDERIVLKRWGQAVADELSSNDRDRPSWVRVEGGWQIHDFEKHHPLRSEIEEKRAKVSEARSRAGKRGNESRWHGNDDATESQDDRKPIANDRSQSQSQAETTKEPLSAAGATDRNGTLIPDDWAPNQKHRDLAVSLRADLGRERDRFIQHAREKQRRLKNWNTGFTNWLKTGAVMAQQRNGAPARGSGKPVPLVAVTADNEWLFNR